MHRIIVIALLLLCSELSSEYFFMEESMIRIGVIGIVVTGDRSVAMEIQKIVSGYADIICGRMGIPHHEENISTISLIVKGENEKISALTGKLGRLPGVNVKSALNNIDLQ